MRVTDVVVCLMGTDRRTEISCYTIVRVRRAVINWPFSV